MAKETVMGRRSIFRGKEVRVQGDITRFGSQRFEAARARVAKLAGRKTASDGDTIEYLALGHMDATDHIAAQRVKDGVEG